MFTDLLAGRLHMNMHLDSNRFYIILCFYPDFYVNLYLIDLS